MQICNCQHRIYSCCWDTCCLTQRCRNTFYNTLNVLIKIIIISVLLTHMLFSCEILCCYNNRHILLLTQHLRDTVHTLSKYTIYHILCLTTSLSCYRKNLARCSFNSEFEKFPFSTLCHSHSVLIFKWCTV